MPSDAPPLVDVDDIVHLVGSASFQRARGYARGGAVSDIDWEESSGTLTSKVKGGSPRPYRSRITLTPTTDGMHRPVSSACSCPVSGNCKHVAATLLESNATHVQRMQQRGGVEDRRTAPLTVADLDAAQKSEKLANTRPAEPSWKTAMTALTAKKTASTARPFGASADTTAKLPRTPLALQFEVREQTPRTPDRWRGPTAKAATTNAEPGVSYRMGVRPVIPGTSGNWVRSNITWNSITHQINQLALNADQHRWFAEFAALYRATTRDVYTGQDADWILLDDFHSPLLWSLLRDATKLGIELVGAKRNVSVRIGSTADIKLDATANTASASDAADGNDLRFDTVLTIDDEQYPATAAGAIGNHGVYSFEITPETSYVLAPTAASLTDEQRRLLKQPEPLVVPAADVDEFLTEFFPKLRRSVEVTSTDDSVVFPEMTPPVLVLTAAYRAKNVLRLSWEWEYLEGATLTRLPLRPTAGDDDLRDVAMEQVILESAEQVLHQTVEGDAFQTLQPTTNLQGLPAAEFTTKTLPALEELSGVRVEVDGTQPDYFELTEAPQLSIRTVETERRDWFDLGVIVTIEGRDIPFGPLFKALAKGKKKLLLVDNSYLSLDHPAFEELHRLINEASTLQEWETTPQISRYQAGLWAEFEDLADETEQAQTWRAAVAGLMALDTVDLSTIDSTPLPASIQAEMRPYQREGFNWLAFLWKHQLGGILADDMGLGKTLQTLALISHALDERESSTSTAPFLVVAPTSVVSNWLAEAAHF
ncbi:MAG: SNF2-related protein, partial [Glaciihabitans sp.]